MKTIIILSVFLGLFVPARANDIDFINCKSRYERVGHIFTNHGMNTNYSLIPSGEMPSLLSYAGQNALMFDGTRFTNTDGVLQTSVQDVMKSKNPDALNAALVYEFLTTADNDSDYPEVQLMALQLQPQFPNVRVDILIYWIISANPNAGKKMDFPFCRGKLWSWGEIQNWLSKVAIPKFLKDKPELIGPSALCIEDRSSNPSSLVCEQE